MGTELDRMRRFALGLPEATEEPHFDLSSWRVRGKIFATLPPGGELLRLRVDPDEWHALVEGNPAAYAEVVWGKRPIRDWVEVHLPVAPLDEVRELVEEAWRLRAPKRLVAAYDAEHAI
jgi:hypothetical protein